MPAVDAGNVGKKLPGHEVEEVPAGDAGIVRLVVDLPGGQVQSRQVGRVKGNVAAEQFADQIGVGTAGS